MLRTAESFLLESGRPQSGPHSVIAAPSAGDLQLQHL